MEGMTQLVPLSVATPPDVAMVSESGESPTALSSPRCDTEDKESSEEMATGVSSEYEQSAAAALLGLHTAMPSSPDDDGGDEDQPQINLFGAEAAGHLWDCAAAAAAAGQDAYSPDSPKAFRRNFGYDTPGYPSPKRMRTPKDGAPPPGTSRFRCKFPGCRKLYASTDAVRKHCRKRHLEWLRQIDRFSAHERGMPKPALYCVWGDDDDV